MVATLVNRVNTLANRVHKRLSGKALGHLDIPTDDQIVSGMLSVEGWIIDPTGPVGEIVLLVDDRPIFASMERKPRPDVDAAYPNDQGRRGITGFFASVNTLQFPDGRHRLSCVVRNFGEQTTIVSRTFQSRNCPRTLLSNRYLQGSGLEIGALHSPLGVPSGCKVAYVDRMNVHDLRLQYPELADKPLVDVDIIDDGEKLLTVKESSQDFIIANHFIEHTRDPIGTIKRHLDVLTPGGTLYMAVPDKRMTFDHKRPVTSLEHLYRDYQDGPAWSYMEHVHEWVRLVGGSSGEHFEAQVRKIVDMQYSIHFHVWTQNELLEFLVDIRRRLSLPFDIVALAQNGIESIVVLKKWSVL